MEYYKKVMVFALILLLVGLAVGTEVRCQDKPIVLRYSSMWPPTHPQGILAKQWCSDVEKATSGRVKVTIYLGGTLVSPQQTYDSVIKGVVDIGYAVPSYSMGKFPLSDVTNYPLGIPSGLLGSRLAMEYYTKFKPAEFDDVKVLFIAVSGPGIIHTKKPVNRLEDIKGMKIRTVGPLATFISALGAVPVPMPMGDTYDAISRGVVDGIYAPYQVLSDYKLGEVVKYSTENIASSYTSMGMVVMNKERWNAIPSDLKVIIDRVSQEHSDKMGKLGDDSDVAGKAFAMKAGVKIITLTPEEDRRWAEKTAGLFGEYIDSMKKKNLPGEEVVKFYREKIKAFKK